MIDGVEKKGMAMFKRERMKKYKCNTMPLTTCVPAMVGTPTTAAIALGLIEGSDIIIPILPQKKQKIT
jgi:hypothetical protein